MLSEIFYWVLNISIIGSFAGLLILVLRKIKVIPRFAVYFLWMIPLIRMWIPVGVSSQFSLLSLVSKFATKTVIVYESNPQLSFTNSIMGAKKYFPIEYKTNLLADVFMVASVVWIVVALAAILTAVLLYFMTKSELTTAKHIKHNIYISSKIKSPAIYGVFRPRIIIPSDLDEKDIDHILMHEKVHISRKDNLFRVVAVATACVHWFNPFVWIFLKYFFVDMELACDAKVIKNLNIDQAKNYALTILKSAAGRTYFASAFGGAKTKVRIENILSYKKLTLLSGIFFTALGVLIAIVLITNAQI